MTDQSLTADDGLIRFNVRTGCKFIERPRYRVSRRLVSWERRFAKWPHRIEGYGLIWLQGYFVCEIETRSGSHKVPYYDIVHTETVETLRLPEQHVWVS